MTEGLADRIERLSMGEPNSGCWLWMSTVEQRGYAHIVIEGRTVRAHRASYAAFVALPPADLDVLHKCDTPTCVNPLHLFLGTAKDNMADCIAKGRAWWINRTHCVHGHEYTPENTGRATSGHRYCRTCKRGQALAAWHANNPNAKWRSRKDA